MCRFLIVKSRKKFEPEVLVNLFAMACKNSIAPDGELQRDGYGITWKENQHWKTQKSLFPIWEERNQFKAIPETKLLVVHARGAGFSEDRGNIDFNEPFVDGGLCFVFNGFIRKVKLRLKLKGIIGSQKMLSLLKLYLKNNTLKNTLRIAKELMIKNSEKIEGMNIGLIKDEEVSVLCQYSDNKDYYTLHYYEDSSLLIISSQIFGNYDWKHFKKGETKIFR